MGGIHTQKWVFVDDPVVAGELARPRSAGRALTSLIVQAKRVSTYGGP